MQGFFSYNLNGCFSNAQVSFFNLTLLLFLNLLYGLCLIKDKCKTS